MGVRFSSLKTRTAFAISSVIVLTLILNAFYLMVTKRAELRRDIEAKARTFAQLTKAPICAGYETFYASGFYKFRELMRDTMRLDPNVERILIVNVNGQVLFDSDELDESNSLRGAEPPERWIQDPDRLDAVKRLDQTVLHGRSVSKEETLEIIAPHLEEWGRHKLSVIYQVSYKSLRPVMTRLMYATGGLTLVSILMSVAVAMALARRITKPVEELTAGAKGIAEGNFDRRLDIRSGDELQILAEAFNHMTGRLKENVEELEESNKKLAGVNDELKELDRVKSDLLANVSHELRTPLTAIKGYTDYILERKLGPIGEKQEKGLVVVQRNLERLSRTINALLDFSRMELGRITLNIQPFNLAGMLDQIHTGLKSELEKKRLTFASALEPSLPPVIADRDKLSAVLENLIINATKFTPEGGTITVSASRVTGSERPAAEIRVADTGIGIPRDQIGRIFNRFHQVDASTTRRFGGVGLGLSIVKSILDAHGAAILVESQEGVGTVFRFRLPVLEKHEGHGRDAARQPKEGPVLVVGTDPELLVRISGALEDDGLSVLTAASAREGAALAAERNPELVVLTLPLSDPGSLALLGSLRKDARGIPVSALCPAGGVLKLIPLGAVEGIETPLEPSKLSLAVRRVIDGANDRGQAMALVVGRAPDTAALCETLSTEGIEATTVESALQAREVMDDRPPDLVIFDLGLGEAAGLELIEAVHRRGGVIPLFLLRGSALSAASHVGAVAEYRALDTSELIAEVRGSLGRERAAARRASL
jgi:signal transduction histidine kinase/DNA-binding response OmpR family regulator